MIDWLKNLCKILKIFFVLCFNYSVLWCKHNGPFYAKALIWVCAVLFFTFTEYLIAMATVSKDTFTEFYTHQMKDVTLLVDIGLLIMLLLDYEFSNVKTWPKRINWLTIIGFVLCFLTYLHSRANHANEIKNLFFPVCESCLSVILFIGYILILTYIKYTSLLPITPKKILTN